MMALLLFIIPLVDVYRRGAVNLFILLQRQETDAVFLLSKKRIRIIDIYSYTGSLNMSQFSLLQAKSLRSSSFSLHKKGSTDGMKPKDRMDMMTCFSLIIIENMTNCGMNCNYKIPSAIIGTIKTFSVQRVIPNYSGNSPIMTIYIYMKLSSAQKIVYYQA